MGKSILVTGGAGYIGSHVVLQLVARGERVVVLDNLSTGYREAVRGAELVIGDTGDAPLVARVLAQHRVESVIHFAAHIVVPESVAHPLKYYGNNTCSTRALLECCTAAGVGHFIFSSTAAVYGSPPEGYAAEDSPLAPINPYGRSKLMTEWMLEDLGAIGALRYGILRYFNVAGADSDGRIGQSTPQATHLIKVACQAAVGKRESVSIFGTDYPTPDGTGVRDYIHVEDLDALRAGSDSFTINCGYGRGYSVREVLAAVSRVSGQTLKVIEGPRRPGDPATLVARADRIRDRLDWRPQRDDLDLIVRTALEWERAPRYGRPD
jgi:UDP-glucose 4-epimerase